MNGAISFDLYLASYVERKKSSPLPPFIISVFFRGNGLADFFYLGEAFVLGEAFDLGDALLFVIVP